MKDYTAKEIEAFLKEKVDTRRKLFHVIDDTGMHKNSRLIKMSSFTPEERNSLLAGFCIRKNNEVLQISEHSV